MPFFSKVFRSKDRDGGASKSKKHSQRNGALQLSPPKPHWEDAWLRKQVEPEEVQQLLRGCTRELKSRALDTPFLLLPFRPASDSNAARSFIRNYFHADRELRPYGDRLNQELLLTEPMVLCSVVKWCWSRLAGGVVTWDAYELFRIGEQDSNRARDAFATFIPISVESDARTKIIFDFFDLMAAIAAHGKTNGMGGRKLSRLAGWWAFEQVDEGNGFDGGYKSWSSAADAASHLFFAYLRSLSPDSVRGTNGISALPRSLQTLVQATEYPLRPAVLDPASKVVMIVDSVSPTPFALLRRAKHFEYRDDDRVLQEFSNYEDPVQALTDECQRVLKCISSTNQSTATRADPADNLPDASWSRFEDIGFGGFGDCSDRDEQADGSALGKKRKAPNGLQSAPQSTNDYGRPTTPSWADFLSSGFVDETSSTAPAPLLLPPDKVLPPIDVQSRRLNGDGQGSLEPGELASINTIRFDDAFWWVWMSSLAGEETTERKSVFGRCALIETGIRGGKWLIMEEIVKGAAPQPEEGAYIAEKKSRFGFSTRGRFARTKSITGKPTPPLKTDPYARGSQSSPMSKTSIGPDQHARIQAAAAALQQRQKQKQQQWTPESPRRARTEDTISTKTNSVFTLQPVIMSEAAPAMKWANSYDKNVVRAAYLGNDFAGRGSNLDLSDLSGTNNIHDMNGYAAPEAREASPSPAPNLANGLPRNASGLSGTDSMKDRDLPALPLDTPQQHDSTAASGKSFPLPPAPLPPTTKEETSVSNEGAAQAAEVPLPLATPSDKENPLGRKPLPPVKPDRDSDNGPVMSDTEPAMHVHTNGISSQTSSPEGKKAGKKLIKTQGGGLKGLFGRKKSELPSLPAPPQPIDSPAVAAARAAYIGPAMKPNYNASQTNLGRRFSGIGRKKAPSLPSAPLSPVYPVQHSEARDLDRSTVIVKKPSEALNGHIRSDTHLNRVDTNEERQANREFHRFDQGPMMDQPAFVPEDTPEQQQPKISSPTVTLRETQSIKNEPTVASSGQPQEPRRNQIPTLHAPGREAMDNDSESEDDRSESLAMDRWAQIRKNAAERAAQQNQNRTRRAHIDRTDDGDGDGETSGDETIESRVARIKARVAELTGNMDGAKVTA